MSATITNWDQVGLTVDIATTARILNRSVRHIERALKAGRMHPAPIADISARPGKRQSRVWSKAALRAWVDGGYLAFVEQAHKNRRAFFGGAAARMVSR